MRLDLMHLGGRHFAAALPIGLLACALLLPTVAQASVVQVSAGQLRIDGPPGERNQVEVLYKTAAEAGFNGESSRFVVKDDAGAQGLGPDCVALEPTTISCDARPVNYSIAANLGDGDDVLVVNASRGDAVPWSYRTVLRGQIGADVIRGGVGDDRLLGGAGRDVLAGWSGNDWLIGGIGSDGLIGFAGHDRLEGEKGRDALFGQKGPDALLGGPQNDVLLARDGFRDPQINCGPGGLDNQRAITDSRDPRPHSCGPPPTPNGKKHNSPKK